MSSWFTKDTKAYMASLAKNAVREAQKTLDRALEIPDDDGMGSVDIDGKVIYTFVAYQTQNFKCI